MYGHVAKLAEEIQKGAASIEGVEVKLWQVGKSHFIYRFFIWFRSFVAKQTESILFFDEL